MGTLFATYGASDALAFGAGAFLCGVICAVLHIERNAFRYAGITLAIIVLIARTQPGWALAVHRLVEIAVGIAVGPIVTAIWPESRTGLV
jgi:uncharacterized membrane protein YgaE (UPF0421/DUF939 family)